MFYCTCSIAFVNRNIWLPRRGRTVYFQMFLINSHPLGRCIGEISQKSLSFGKVDNFWMLECFLQISSSKCNKMMILTLLWYSHTELRLWLSWGSCLEHEFYLTLWLIWGSYWVNFELVEIEVELKLSFSWSRTELSLLMFCWAQILI